MKLYTNPTPEQIDEIITRNTKTREDLTSSVRAILDDVKQNGDKAVANYTKRFDGVENITSALTKEQLRAASKGLPDSLKTAIAKAKDNIAKFHSSQIEENKKIQTSLGVTCWRRSIPIENVGLYIPGGSAPLFSTLLMLGIPAKLAGCKNIVVTTPPQKASPQKDGSIHPAIAYVLDLLEIYQVHLIGGVQAIAALAYGTETVTKVDKIFGPGNQYVTVAKQLVSEEKVAIDLPAGPSEVAIIADNTANPRYVAADLISQAEHGEDSVVLLVTDSEQLLEEIKLELQEQLLDLPRKEIASAALAASKLVLVDEIKDAFSIVNKFAPEHLIIATKEPLKAADFVVNAGSVFIGNFAAESFGDYASGTNHVLPTDGYARNYSGVSIDSFVRKVTFQEITHQGVLDLGSTVIEMASAEGLEGHARAVKYRMEN